MAEVGGTLYLFLKLAHILGVVLFFGGLVTSLYWKVTADRTGDAAHIARVHKRIRQADSHIVGPGAFVTFAAGYAMVRGFGSTIGETPFALWGLILMFTALAIWYVPMRRVGDKLASEAEAASLRKEPLSQSFATQSVAWLTSSFLVISLVLVVTVMMVFRLPGG